VTIIISLFGTAANLWPIVPAPNDNVPMMIIMEQSVEYELAGETEVLGANLPSATLSTTNPI
jgi:hypothetical protein